jgi:ribosomal-protein-alanine N-acetyltransferase
MNIELNLTPIDETSAHEIARWRYKPPYDVYNLEDDKDTIAYVLEPHNRFYTVHDGQGELIGFCSFGEDGQVPGGDYNQEALDIGMGIRPDLTGQGLGGEYISSVLDFSKRKFSPKLLRVTIARFNRRAQRVWIKNGFQMVDHFIHEPSGREFLVYVLEINPQSNFVPE